MGGKSHQRSSLSSRSSRPTLLLSVCLLLVWFSSSVLSTLVNKALMDSFPYAVTLSAVHMLSACLVDLAVIRWRGLEIKWRPDVLRACIPVALSINFGKTLTYVSYGLVPASLTHTAKASSPVFSVGLAKLLFGQVASLPTILSLVPITVGVTLAACTEIHWVWVGFLAAVAAALANVLNSMYTKRALHLELADPLVFHAYTAALAVSMLLPYALVVEMPNMTLFQPVALPPGLTGEAAIDLRPGHSGALHVFPFRSMLLSLLLHYAQNISNIYFLNGVSVLTHQVAQSSKRLLNILGAVIYFRQSVSVWNALGMGLALVGFSMYSYEKQRANASARARGFSSASAANSPGQVHTTRTLSPAHVSNGSSAYHPPASPVELLVEASHGVGGASSQHLRAFSNGSSGNNSLAHVHQLQLGSWNHAAVHGAASRGSVELMVSPSVSPDSAALSVRSPTLHQTAHAHSLHAAHTPHASSGLSVQTTPRGREGHASSGPHEPLATPRENDFCV